MNITKDVINDLYPLYADQECSADTRALVEEFLRSNPRHAEELRQTMRAQLPGIAPSARDLDEVKSLREARRRLRLRGTVMGFAIFFSLAPFSVFTDGVRTHWLFLESPGAAAIYAAIAAGLWMGYALMRRRASSL